ERGILAAQLLRYVGVVDGEALDVQLVDDGLVPGRVGPPVVAPGECRIDDLALGHAERAVAIVGREILAPAADAITEMRVAPAQRIRPARPDRDERLHRTRAGRTAHASPARWVATCGAPRIVTSQH